MEPRSGYISCKTTHPATRHLSLEALDISINLSDHMSVPTYYVCPHLLCLSPPIMSVPTFHVCPHLLCLSPPIVSVPILTSLKNILIWPTQLGFRVWHSQLSLFLSKMLDVRKDATRKGGVTVTSVRLMHFQGWSRGEIRLRSNFAICALSGLKNGKVVVVMWRGGCLSWISSLVIKFDN